MDKKTLPGETLRLTISYLYLLSFCPPEQLQHFRQAGALLRRGLLEKSGLPAREFFAKALPEACRRIVAFHQHTREPDAQLVNLLSRRALTAQDNAAGVAAFTSRMEQISRLAGRAKRDNRLRKGQGCQLCASPCRFGFFVLSSQPRYSLLHELLQAEAARPEAERDVVQAASTFAQAHLWRSLGIEQSYISPGDLANLAYCLLALGTAKSRYPFPEAQYRTFQQANQALVA